MQRISGFIFGVVVTASLGAFAQASESEFADDDSPCMMYEVEEAACQQNKSILLTYAKVLEQNVESGRLPTIRRSAEVQWRVRHPGPYELPPNSLSSILEGRD